MFVAPPDRDHPFFEALLRSHKDNLFVVHDLNSALCYDKRDQGLAGHDCGGDEGARPPETVRVGELDHNTGGAGCTVDERADEHNLAFGYLADTACRDGDSLADLDRGQIRDGDGRFDPDLFEIDNHEEIGLEI